jgi:hypothetical protein
MESIARNCSSLRRLTLKFLKNIDQDGIRRILQACPVLGIVDLTGCTAIATSAVNELRGLFPSINFAHLDLEHFDVTGLETPAAQPQQ